MLLELMLVTLIGSIICIGTVNFLLHVAKVYLDIQQKFALQNNKLIAKHYIYNDLKAANYGVIIYNADEQYYPPELPAAIVQLNAKKSIKIGSDILIIKQQENTIIYYLRKSIVPCANKAICYALYRDDSKQQAIALVENILAFTAHIVHLSLDQYLVNVQLELQNHEQMEIKCLHAMAATAAP